MHNSHGVDLILGGHDHLYYASKGVSSWDNYDVNEKALGAEDDNGDILVVKSGTDFRDLSEISLELVDSPSGSIRGKVISKITGMSLAASVSPTILIPSQAYGIQPSPALSRRRSSLIS